MLSASGSSLLITEGVQSRRAVFDVEEPASWYSLDTSKRARPVTCALVISLCLGVAYGVSLLCLAFMSVEQNTSGFDYAAVMRELEEKQPTWQYEDYPHFSSATHAQAMSLLGGSSGSDNLAKPDAPWTRGAYVPAELPHAFDTRSRWPECAVSLWHVRDQSQCGSCWAFGSTTAFNDRVCIASGGAMQQLLSPTDLLSCAVRSSGYDGAGCHGGQAGDAFRYFRDHGLVSGGDYDDNNKTDTCWPYPLHEFTVHSGKHDFEMPACRDTCSNTGFPKNFTEDKHMGKTAYQLNSVEEVKRDLMAHGPVACAFDVYEDFMAYKGGVYKHTTGKYMDGHVIRILGWGVESGVEYWHAANSWNIWWGEHGFFRIAVGDSNINANTSCVAGEAAWPSK